MSKRAEISKITLIGILGPLGAELLLIFLWVVKGFNSVVSLGASIFLRTATRLRVLAHLR